MELALALGMTRAKLRVEMGSSELTDWWAFNEINPFVQWRADYRAAMTTAMVAASAGVEAKPSDFMWTYKEPKKTEEVWQDIQACLGGKENGSQ
jgi:hypothetical protein